MYTESLQLDDVSKFLEPRKYMSLCVCVYVSIKFWTQQLVSEPKCSLDFCISVLKNFFWEHHRLHLEETNLSCAVTRHQAISAWDLLLSTHYTRRRRLKTSGLHSPHALFGSRSPCAACAKSAPCQHLVNIQLVPHQHSVSAIHG